MGIGLNTVKSFLDKNILMIIFLVSLIVYLVCGLCFTYQNDLVVGTSCNILYGLDTGTRYYYIYLKPLETFGIWVHPFFKLIVQPYVSFINALTSSPRITCILAQSLIAACSSCLFFTILKKLKFNNILNLLFTLIFSFSFSNLIFASIPETFIYSGFMHILLLLYAVHVAVDKNHSKLTNINISLISLLLVFSFGINTINLLIAFPIIIFVLIKKCPNLKSFILNLLKVILSIIFIIAILTTMQMKTLNNNESFVDIFPSLSHNDNYSISMHFNNLPIKEKIKYSIKGTVIEPIYAVYSSPSEKKYDVPGFNEFIHSRNTYLWNFDDNTDYLVYLPLLLFILFPLLFFKRYRTNNVQLLFTLLAIIAISLMCNSVYEVKYSFLFSQNSLCYLILFLALLYQNMPNKWSVPACSAFIVVLYTSNFVSLYYLSKFLNDIVINPKPIGIWIAYAMLIVLIIYSICFISKKVIKKEILDFPLEYKYITCLTLYVCCMVFFGIFVMLYKGAI